jgi:hypothetical protein
MAHQGTATVYLSYRAQGGGRAGLSGVRQVLDVTGAKADDFPVSQNRGRKTFCTCSYAHDRKATRPPRGRGRGRPNGKGIAGWTVAPHPPRRCTPDLRVDSGNDPAGARRRGDASTATPGTAGNAPTPAGDGAGPPVGRTAGAGPAAGHRRRSPPPVRSGSGPPRPVTRPGSLGTPRPCRGHRPAPAAVRPPGPGATACRMRQHNRTSQSCNTVRPRMGDIVRSVGNFTPRSVLFRYPISGRWSVRQTREVFVEACEGHICDRLTRRRGWRSPRGLVVSRARRVRDEGPDRAGSASDG